MRKGRLLAVGIRLIGVMATFSSLCGFAVQYYNECIPSKICVTSGQEETLSFGLPVTGVIRHKEDSEAAMAINLNEPVTLVASDLTSYDLELQLFGIFALKDVELEIVSEKYLIPAGIPIGIYLETEGVMVVDIGEVETLHGKTTPAKYILQKGDYILAVNGESVEKKKDLTELVEKSDGEGLVLTINRGNTVFNAKVIPEKSAEGKYQIGVWVRDNAQGIGTLTYVDEQGSFGALGHGIHDGDTGEVVHIDMGSLYETEIIQIKKGTAGTPGELTGTIVYNNRNVLGDIYSNTECGIRGSSNSKLMRRLTDYEKLPIGYKQHVKTGAAQIICCISGERRAYDVEITEIHYDSAVENKGLELKVTDAVLLQETGGIVQGMGVRYNRDNTGNP